MDGQELELRRSIIEACLWMNSSGLNQGTSGNISVRHGDTMLISPSGVPYEQLEPEDIVAMPLEGEYGSYKARGANIPSSEWRFHLDIMRARPEVGAIVHTHSTYATVLAIARKEIPACHYMIAASGGSNIRCADYATYGTAELSEAALKALEGRTCCILANHGMIATGPNLAKAKWLAVELETIAKQYYLSLSIGGPVLLPEAEIENVKERFKSYGPRPKAEIANENAQGPEAKPRKKKAK
jgi:L-fuculose-phosphate aldolase